MRNWFIKRLERAIVEEKLPYSGDPEALLAFGRAESVVFLSTELLYTGKPRVTQYFAVEDQTQATRDKVLSIAGSLAAASGAPIMSAVEALALQSDLVIREVETDVVSECGVMAKVDRSWYVFGDEAALALEEIDIGFSVQTLARQIEKDGAYTLFLAQTNPKRLMGVFACSYVVSDKAIEEVSGIKKLGVEPILLSTAKAHYVKAVSKKIGISHCYADLSHEEKQEVLVELLKKSPTLISSHEHGIEIHTSYKGKQVSGRLAFSNLVDVLQFARAWEKRGRRVFA